jgi:hypothetical protein
MIKYIKVHKIKDHVPVCKERKKEEENPQFKRL